MLRRSSAEDARRLPDGDARHAGARAGGGRGGRGHRRDRLPVLRPARRRAGHPPRRRAGARRRHAHGACLEVLARDPRARRRAADPDDVRLDLRRLRLGASSSATRARRARRRFIVADLPADVRAELRRVQLVAPTSTDERLRLAADATDGWLYLVTVTGTTGARAELAPPSRRSPSARGRVTDVPLYAGFGISTGEHARAAGRARRRGRRRLARGRGGGGRARRARRRSSRELARRPRRVTLVSARGAVALVVGAGVHRRVDRARARAARLGRHARRAVHARHRPLGFGRRHAAAPRGARRRRLVHRARAGARARSGSSCRSETGTRIWEPIGLAWFAHRDDGFEAQSRATLDRGGRPVRVAVARTTRATSSPRSPSTTCTRVLWEPDAGVLHARRATQLLVEEAERLGAARCAGADRPGRRARGRRRRLGVRRLAARALPQLAPVTIERRDVFFFGGDARLGRRARLRASTTRGFYGHGESAGSA